MQRAAKLCVLGASIAACSLSWSASAQAQRVGVAVTSVEPAPVAAAELGEAAQRSLVRRGFTVVPDPVREAAVVARAGVESPERAAGLTQATDAARTGWKSYQMADYSQAAAQLSSARDIAGKLLDVRGAIAIYGEIALKLGVVQLELADADAAANLALARRLLPQRSVTDDEFKPAAVEAYHAAGAEQTRAPLSFRVTPASATVSIDGVAAGTGTISTELVVGDHVVAIAAPGYVARAQRFRHPSGLPAVIDLSPDPAAAPLLSAAGRGFAAGQSATAADALLGATARFAKLEALVLVSSVYRQGGPALLMQWCGGVPLRCGSITEVRYPAASPTAKTPDRRIDKAMSEAIDRVTRPDEPRNSPPTLPSDARITSPEPAPVPIVGPGRSWYRSPWVWVGVGAVAIAVAGALILTADTEIDPIVGGDPCQFGSC